MVRPLPFTWPYAVIFYGAFLWAFLPESRIVRSARRSQGKSDRRSLQVIILGQGLGSFLAFGAAFIPGMQMRGPSARYVAFYSGMLLLILGSLLRRHCWRMLGASFTGDVRVSPDQQIVTRGAYSLLRHPSYTAGIVMNVGIALALGSWASVALIAIASSVAYQYRMNVEERALAATIGEPYRQFVKTRKRLIPYLY